MELRLSCINPSIHTCTYISSQKKQQTEGDHFLPLGCSCRHHPVTGRCVDWETCLPVLWKRKCTYCLCINIQCSAAITWLNLSQTVTTHNLDLSMVSYCVFFFFSSNSNWCSASVTALQNAISLTPDCIYKWWIWSRANELRTKS